MQKKKTAEPNFGNMDPAAAASAMTRRRRGNRCALSFAQERLWFINELDPSAPTYNEPFQLRLRGSLNVEALGAALNAIVARHESLRTTFDAEDGIPVQVIASAGTVELPLVDFSTVHASTRMDETLAAARDEILRPFDLHSDLMLRARLLRLEADDHILVLTLHHIASDGWSLSVVGRELSEFYRAFVEGTPPLLPELPVQYADFAIWQREYLKGPLTEEQLSYWTDQFRDKPEFESVHPDHPRPPHQTSAGAMEQCNLSPELFSKLKSLSQRERASMFMVLLSGLNVLLQRYSGRTDVVVGTVTANRNHVEIEEMIGFFVNILALRTDLSGDPTFRTVLRRVRDVALAAYEAQDVPFETVVHAVAPERSLSHTPLFQVMLAFQNTPPQMFHLPQLTVEVLENRYAPAKMDLLFDVYPYDGLCIKVKYNRDLFDAATIRRMVGHYAHLLEEAVRDPDAPISRLTMLSAAEQHLLLTEWNNTHRDYPQACIHQLFEAQAASRPDAVAAVCGKEQLTYAELNRRANALAVQLRTCGIATESTVGICVRRSLEMLVGLLAILKAGGAYVPLDPTYPRERLAYMLEDCGASVLLTETEVASKLPLFSGRVITLDSGGAIEHINTDIEAAHVTPDSLAYVIYTSGSTGNPKGVEVTHRGVVRLLLGTDYAHLGPEEVILQLAPVSFDASTFEIWGALLHGARCVLYPGSVSTVRELADVLRQNQVSTLWLTASLFNTVIDELPSALAGIRQLLIGGEALSVAHVKRALVLLPATTIVNGYGPTEGTTFTCCYQIPRTVGACSSIPIGKPIANTRAYILDSSLQPCPLGVAGELYIGGDGLARGYRNHPELTSEKFIPSRLADIPDARLYRSGDLVRRLTDGNIEFLGRLDDQVKIRGFRIELGEIEAALRAAPGVRSAAVAVSEAVPGGKRLIAYVVTESKDAGRPDALREFLQRKVPEYMLPARFISLPALPLLPNGKLDRRGLPVPDLNESHSRILKPRDSIESRLVHIWSQVLGVAEISVDDNFFDLGGHSLLAARVLSRIERVFGKKIALAELFDCPTIEQLAVRLREARPATPPSRVVAIQSAGSRKPFLCIGAGPMVRPLAQRLGSDQPFFGIKIDQQDLASFSVPYEMKEWAARLVGIIREAQPAGPYFLGGFCLDGVFAYEVARQLQESGQQVGLLALFDAPNPAAFRGASATVKIVSLLQRVLAHLAVLWNLHPSKAPNYLWEIMTELAAKLRRTRYRLSYRVRLAVSDGKLTDFEQLWYLVGMQYTPRPYSGRVVLFRSPTASHDLPIDFGWQSVVPQIEIEAVPGGHTGMFEEPMVTNLAALLSSYLSCASGPEHRYEQSVAAT